MDQVLCLLKAVSQSTRLRILMLLADSELCSCELVQLIDVSQPAISQHMDVLKRAGLVEERKSGTWVYYRLVPAEADRMLSWLAQALQAPRVSDGLSEDDWVKMDRLLMVRQQQCSQTHDNQACSSSVQEGI